MYLAILQLIPDDMEFQSGDTPTYTTSDGSVCVLVFFCQNFSFVWEIYSTITRELKQFASSLLVCLQHLISFVPVKTYLPVLSKTAVYKVFLMTYLYDQYSK